MRPEDVQILKDLDHAIETVKLENYGPLVSFMELTKARVEIRLQDANDFEEAFDEVSTSIQRLNLECQRTMKSSQRLVVTLETLKKD